MLTSDSRSTQLLQRIENQDLTGFTAMHVVSEVAHKMMTIEANGLLGWPFAGMANRLRRHPAEVRRLSIFRQVLNRIASSRIQVFSNSLPELLSAAAISQQTGLLINDALIVALMRLHGLTRLASHDADFDRVPGLTRHAPV